MVQDLLSVPHLPRPVGSCRLWMNELMDGVTVKF